MLIHKSKFITGLVLLLSVAGWVRASINDRPDRDDVQPFRLPPVCANLQVRDLVAPLANLYDDRNFSDEAVCHYAGPTWETKNGSKVVGRKTDEPLANGATVGEERRVPYSAEYYFYRRRD